MTQQNKKLSQFLKVIRWHKAVVKWLAGTLLILMLYYFSSHFLITKITIIMAESPLENTCSCHASNYMVLAKGVGGYSPHTLLKLIQHEQPTIRSSALMMLQDADIASITSELQELSKHQDPEISTYCLIALARNRDIAAAKRLLEIIKTKPCESMEFKFASLFLSRCRASDIAEAYLARANNASEKDLALLVNFLRRFFKYNKYITYRGVLIDTEFVSLDDIQELPPEKLSQLMGYFQTLWDAIKNQFHPLDKYGLGYYPTADPEHEAMMQSLGDRFYYFILAIILLIWTLAFWGKSKEFKNLIDKLDEKMYARWPWTKKADEWIKKYWKRILLICLILYVVSFLIISRCLPAKEWSDDKHTWYAISEKYGTQEIYYEFYYPLIKLEAVLGGRKFKPSMVLMQMSELGNTLKSTTP